MTDRTKLALVESAVHSEQHHPQARRLDDRVSFARDGNDFGYLELAGDELVLAFGKTGPKVVTELRVPEIVRLIADRAR